MKQSHGNKINCNQSKSHGGDRWAAEKRWGIPAHEFLDFSASINPLGPSLSSLQAIKENLHLVECYPEPHGLVLKSELADYLKIGSQPIILANGSSEFIYLCARMFSGGRIIVLAPSFSEYGQGAEYPEIVRINLDLNDLCLPLEALAEVLKANDLIFIANPNNPTGNLFARKELLELLVMVRGRRATLVLDETFIDFLGVNPSYSLRDVSCKEPGLIIIGSLTKFFALPGLRIGYALGSQENLEKMEQMLPPWRVNSLALAAGTAALRDKDYIHATIQAVNQEREFLTNGLNQIEGLSVYPGQANFILINSAGRGIKAVELQEKLGLEGILIRDCSDFYNLSPYHFRAAVRSNQENQVFLATLRKVFNQL